MKENNNANPRNVDDSAQVFKDIQSTNSLFMAAQNNNVDAIKRRLQKPKSKIAQLFLAAKKILGFPTEINKLSKNGDSALMIAVKHGNKEAVQELLSHGADIYTKDKSGNMPLEIAIKLGHKSVVHELELHSTGKVTVQKNAPDHCVVEIEPNNASNPALKDNNLRPDPAIATNGNRSDGRGRG